MEDPQRPAPSDDAGEDTTGMVAAERSGALPVRARFFVPALALGVATLAALLVLAGGEGAPLPGEAAAQDDSLFGRLSATAGVDGMRLLAATAGAAAVLATAVAVRLLSHSDVAGLVAGLLVALDPAFLLEAHLALPHALLLASAVGALALALLRHPAAHWLVPLPMALGALVSPWLLVWGIPLALLLLLRGHVYAAPKHLVQSAAQALLLPAAVALPVYAFLDGPALCGPGRLDALLVRGAAAYGEGHVALHGPAVWFAGLFALVALAAAAGGHVLGRFRIGRAPGRVQVRLPAAMPRVLGRGVWLLALAAAAPTPVLWLPVFAGAFALGADHLRRDSPAFAWLLHGAVLAFAAIYLVRLWGLVVGSGDTQALLGAVPWAHVVACG